MRIISGQFKGKKLLKPNDQKTRPLKDLVKDLLKCYIKLYLKQQETIAIIGTPTDINGDT